MSKPSRVFVALPVPKDRAEKLERLQSLVAPSFPGARWVVPSMFHATLAFLGDVPDAGLAPLCRSVSEAVRDLPPLTLKIEGLGVFPGPERPRVVWVGLGGEDRDRLAALAEAVAGAARGAGYAPEDDRFSPHITLGRLKPGKGPVEDCTPLLRHYAKWSAGPLAAPEVVTYSSQMTPEGPAYVPLGRAPLRGGP